MSDYPGAGESEGPDWDVCFTGKIAVRLCLRCLTAKGAGGRPPTEMSLSPRHLISAKHDQVRVTVLRVAPGRGGPFRILANDLREAFASDEEMGFVGHRDFSALDGGGRPTGKSCRDGEGTGLSGRRVERGRRGWRSIWQFAHTESRS